MRYFPDERVLPWRAQRQYSTNKKKFLIICSSVFNELDRTRARHQSGFASDDFDLTLFILNKQHDARNWIVSVQTSVLQRLIL